MKSLFISLMATLLCLSAVSKSYADGEKAEDMSALDKRILIERNTRNQSFVLTPHKPNYILPLTYNSEPSQTAFESRGGEVERIEIKFQFSVKFPILEKILGGENSLQFAYTNLSFWQAYNDNESYPFRETNHEPEVFFIFVNDWEIFGMKNRLIQLGIVHQSNGRSAGQSRTWNRVYADMIFQHNDFYLSFKPWYHLAATDSAKDENPDIDKFYGHSEIRAAYAGGTHTASIMLRNYLEHPSYGALEINWSFPMTKRVKWFVQYFNGYGESLIDYNVRTNRLGVGIAFTDWL